MTARTHVAFLRFVTLGRGGQTNAAFTDAYRDAGATDVATFISTGNVVFAAPSDGDPVLIAARARGFLRARIGFDQPAHVRSLADMAAVVARDPFRAAPTLPPGADRRTPCVTFLPPDAGPLPPLPAATPRGDLVLLGTDDVGLYSVSFRIDGRDGDPNAWAERHAGPGASTRTWGMVERLVARFA